MMAKFLNALDKFPITGKTAVAVSGGGDSMALALLLKSVGHDILALTVDHGLRAESRAEAERVHTLLTARGIPHEILTWQGAKPQTHIQERARDARYDLLLKKCREENIKTLAVAHNLEDQIETFWMRLSKGSGLTGLAAMAPVRHVEGIDIIRPLLTFTRAELRDYCRAENLDYIDDPSNTDAKYLRVKLRAFEDTLAAEGLSPQRLSQTLQKLEDSRAALQWLTDQAYAAAVEEGADAITLNAATLKNYPAVTRHAVLSRIIQSLQPQDYAPGAEALQRLDAALITDGFKGATLGGCVFAVSKTHDLTISREYQEEKLA